MIVQTVIDVQKVFENTWGYIGLPYPEILIKRFLKGEKPLPTFEFETDTGGSELPKYPFAPWMKKERSTLGVPLRTTVKESGYADIFLPIWLFEEDATPDEAKYLLPLSMMRMTCKKNIVTTPLVNRNGTVKEEISIDDWELDIKGVMVGLDGDYPDAELQTLAGWWERSAALNIQNAKTAICMSGGEKVVITSLALPECKGFENTQPYELKMISDVPFSLYIS
jgi:hypothetical protein